MNRILRAPLWLMMAVMVGAGCLDMGQGRVEMPLWVAGTASAEPISIAEGWSVTLTQADLAFGPLYLCPGYQAGPLCDTARMEWTGSVVIDALDPDLQAAGRLVGVTGPVKSWMYDYGITSLLTQPSPTELAAAEALGDNSLLLAGVASKGPYSIAFRVAMPLRQEEDVGLGVSVVRKSASDDFAHEIGDADAGLTVRFDPRSWVADIDFDALVEARDCSGAATVVCDRAVELSCDGGEIQAERDCASLGQSCVRGLGCVDRVEFSSESQGYRAVRTALVAGTRPEFEWSTDLSNRVK